MSANVLSCLIIADDFTGACDTGLQFVRNGLSASVISSPYQSMVAPSVDVVVCNTESRNEPAEVAGRRVAQACRWLRAWHPALMYKKVDSTIRGNLAAEIEAVMEVFDIAGKGIADHANMVSALRFGSRLANARMASR